jgi:hypothetical protein
LEKLFSPIKRNVSRPRFQVGTVITLICLLYFITLRTVPFHPDEATYLYMSDDFTTMLSDPLSLSYQPGETIDLRTHYRLMDPPMTRLFLGLARTIISAPSIQTDWDWTATWQENLSAGNLPDQRAIFIGRFALLLLLPFVCFFIYRTANSLMSHWPAIFTTILFAINPLIILHFRRNMAEALLLIFCTWFLMLLTDRKTHKFLLPLIFALALNSKQTAIFLLPMYISYLIWCLLQSPKKEWLLYIASYTIIPILITFLVNPVAWSQPAAAIRASIAERSALIQGNEYFLQQNQPGAAQQNIAERMLAVIYHTAYEPLALDDFANYREAQQTSFTLYKENLFQNHSRNLILGTFYVIIVLSAILMQWIWFWKQRKVQSADLLPWIFIQIGFFSSLIGLSILSSIYQRYVVILIPFTSLLIIWLINSMISSLKKQPT